MENNTFKFTGAAAVEKPKRIRKEVRTLSTIPTGSGNLAFDKVCYSFLGLTGAEKLEFGQKIEAKGGVIGNPGKRTQYLIYDTEEGPGRKFWQTAVKREEEGSIYLLTKELFLAWTEPEYSITKLKYEKQLQMICQYLNHRKDWESDQYGRREELESFMTAEVNGALEDIYRMKDCECFIKYVDFISEKEKSWTESGYSDGFYVYSLVNKYVDRSIEEKDLTMTAALLGYKAEHYDEQFMEEADANEMDIEFGKKERAPAYFAKGAEIRFGSYIQSAEDGAGTEPIEWEVLKQENGKVLLISKYGLITKRYNKTYTGITWENCSLRKWLNEEFFKEAFTEEEQERIQKVTNNNPDNEYYRTKGGNDTEDRIFLLSIDEVKEYFRSDEAMIKKATPYAKKSGADTNSSGSCWWWLRSPGDYDYDYGAALVDLNGGVIEHSHYVNYDESCVCPALWLEISNPDSEIL